MGGKQKSGVGPQSGSSEPPRAQLTLQPSIAHHCPGKPCGAGPSSGCCVSGASGPGIGTGHLSFPLLALAQPVCNSPFPCLSVRPRVLSAAGGCPGPDPLPHWRSTAPVVSASSTQGPRGNVGAGTAAGEETLIPSVGTASPWSPPPVRPSRPELPLVFNHHHSLFYVSATHSVLEKRTGDGWGAVKETPPGWEDAAFRRALVFLGFSARPEGGPRQHCSSQGR